MERYETVTSRPLQLSQQVESMLGQIRHLEAALIKEQVEGEQLREYTKDKVAKLQEIQKRDTELRSMVEALRDRDLKNHDQLKALHAEVQRVRAELYRYQSAWSGVVQREKHAKALLADYEKFKKKAQEFDHLFKKERARSENAERSANQYHAELQSALVRLHAAERKFTELTRELQALHQTKRLLDQELVNIEKAMRERYEIEIINEREKIRGEVERELRQEMERIRDTERERLRLDMDRKLSTERDKLHTELNQSFMEQRARLQIEYQMKAQEQELALSRLANSLEVTHREIHQLRVENEKLRSESDVQELRQKLRLIEDGSHEMTREFEKVSQRAAKAETELNRISQEKQFEETRANLLEKALYESQVELKEEIDNLKSMNFALQDKIEELSPPPFKSAILTENQTPMTLAPEVSETEPSIKPMEDQGDEWFELALKNLANRTNAPEV